MRYYIGCSGFYNKDWKETFYPKELPQNKWFEHYCTQFNTLELNTTFYRFPTVKMLQQWFDKSPADFKFSVKAPRLITHYKLFNECKTLLDDFYGTIKEGLHEKAGMILFQLPGRVEYSEELLQRIIENIHSDHNNTIEFRHESWWNKYVFDELAKHNISFCGVSIKDLSTEIIANTSTIYYRFHGIKKLYFSEYSKQTINNFATELMQLHEAKEAYIFFNNTATMAAIHNARQLKEKLKQ